MDKESAEHLIKLSELVARTAKTMEDLLEVVEKMNQRINVLQQLIKEQQNATTKFTDPKRWNYGPLYTTIR